VSLTGNGEQDLLGGERARAVAIQAGLDLWRSQPLFGVGFGAFQFLSPQFGATVATYSHNQWLSILAEQGIVGLSMILGIVLLTGATLWRSTHPLRATALAMLVAYMVGSLFINSGPDPQISSLTWIVLGAVFAGGSRIGGVSISPRRYAA
jgi:O-antigen ligase